MRVLVIGDYYPGTGDVDEVVLDDPDGAREATRALGACLATDGNELVVCTDNPDTADYEFACAALQNGSSDFCLTIYSPAGVKYPFERQLRGSVRQVRYEMSPFDAWEIVHMEAIEYADVIVLVGGSGRWHYVTKMLGLAGVALRKIVVPIACFGGETRPVWQSIASSPMRDSYREVGLDVMVLNSPWRQGETEREITDMIREAYRKRTMLAAQPARMTKGNSLAASLAAAATMFVVTAGLWYLLLRTCLRAAFPLPLDPLFGLVVLAGGIGAAANSVYSLWRGEVLSYAHQLISLLVGMSGGLISFLLYLLGQLVFTGDVPTDLADTSALMRNALVASFFGLFSGLFIDRGYDFIRRGSESISASLGPKPK